MVADFEGSETAWTFTSDGRDKKDIVDLDLGLEFINKLQPRKYTWDFRDKSRQSGDENSGFIAQEVLEVLNEYDAKYTGIVKTTDPENYKVGAAALIPMLVNSVKELSATVTELQNEIKALKAN